MLPEAKAVIEAKKGGIAQFRDTLEWKAPTIDQPAVGHDSVLFRAVLFGRNLAEG